MQLAIYNYSYTRTTYMQAHIAIASYKPGYMLYIMCYSPNNKACCQTDLNTVAIYL